MRRRRRHLEVSTFPFLAVLLCTMGSLILLLLVLDRRAKIVALLKAKNDYEHVQAEKNRRDREHLRQRVDDERLAKEDQAEWEKRRQQLHDLVAQEEDEVVGQIHEANEKLAAAADKARAEKDRAEEQKKRLEAARAQLLGKKQAVKAQQEVANKAEQFTDAAKRELERQSIELVQLEQTLAGLKALRERQKNTYSLVPYLGRRGDNRKPMYVECAVGGVVFHPDGVALQGMQLTGERLRAEVEKRIAQQRLQTTVPAGQEQQRPYLLMLVRPDGISNYYRIQEALAGMQMDFGYEFIEPDWVMDFSAEENDAAAQPWMTAAKLSSQLPVSPPSGPNKSVAVGNQSMMFGGGGVAGTGGNGRQGNGPSNPDGPPGPPGALGSGGAGSGSWYGQGGNGGSSGVNSGLSASGTNVQGAPPAAVGGPVGGGSGPGPGGTGGGSKPATAIIGQPVPGFGSKGGTPTSGGEGGTGGGAWPATPASGEIAKTSNGLAGPNFGGPGGAPLAGGGAGVGPWPGSGGGGGGGPMGAGVRGPGGASSTGGGMGTGGTGSGQWTGVAGGGGPVGMGNGPPGNNLNASGGAPGVGGSAGGGSGAPTGGNGGTATAGNGQPGQGNPVSSDVQMSGVPGGVFGTGSGGNGPTTNSGSPGAGLNGPASPSAQNATPAQPGKDGTAQPGLEGSQAAQKSTNGQSSSNNDDQGGGTRTVGRGVNGSGSPGGSPANNGAGDSEPSWQTALSVNGLNYPTGGSQGGSGGSGGLESIGGSSLGTPAKAINKSVPAPPLSRILGNRDWLIYLDCNADGVVIRQGNQKFSVQTLAAPTKGQHALVQAIREIIDRRQATVRPGELPYRPMLHFQVQSGGLRAYYLAYPLLESLKLPMSRENGESPVTDLRGRTSGSKY
jgi:hypothetical protein